MKMGTNSAGERVMCGTCRYCGQIMNVTFACSEDATDAEDSGIRRKKDE